MISEASSTVKGLVIAPAKPKPQARMHAADEAREGVEADEHAQRAHDRQHREHLLEQTEEGAEAVEQKGDQHQQQAAAVAEALGYRADQRADAADVVHHLEGRGDHEQEQREHDQRETVRRSEDQHRREQALPERDAAEIVAPHIVEIVRRPVRQQAELALRQDIGQRDRDDEQSQQQQRDLDEGLAGDVDERRLVFTLFHRLSLLLFSSLRHQVDRERPAGDLPRLGERIEVVQFVFVIELEFL